MALAYLDSADPELCLLETYPSGTRAWWARRMAGQLRMVSPNLDGTDLQLAFENPLEVVRKAIGTATTGVYNPLFSWLLQTQIVQEPNIYNFLPKAPWRGPQTLGWRVKTAAAIASGVGRAEGAAVPADSNATYAQVQPTLKEAAVAWGMNKRLVDAVAITDSISWDQDLEQHTLDFFKAINKDICAPLATVEVNNFEAIRNLLSSNSELTGKSLAANSIDPWLNVDRDAGASWADANTLHNSATDRDLSIALIDQLRENQEPYWNGPDKVRNKAYATKYGTWGRWSRLEAAKQRFNAEGASGEVTINGVRTSPGVKAGFRIATWDGMVAIRDDDVTAETIGDIWSLDFDHFQFSQLRPFEMADEDNPFITGFARRAVWYGSGENTATQFKGSGVLTDLK